MGLQIIKTGDPVSDPAVRALRDRLRAGRAGRGGEPDVPAAVAEVIADVGARGDQAVIDLTARIEKVSLTPERLRVEAGAIGTARAAAEPAFLELIRRAAANVRQYQEAILHADPPPLARGGRRLGLRYRPVDRAGVFVPGGSGSGAALVSSLVMTVVPAQVAGVGEIALVSPPTSEGEVSGAVLAAAGELGVDEVYRVSGTAGVAALALGTGSIPRVDMIVGPGNAFIAEAKRQLFGVVGIDAVAGPSEVLIIADETADASWVAADLLAQAEHDPGSGLLVTPSEALARAAAEAVERELPRLQRAEAIRRALAESCAAIVVPDLPAACAAANDFAAEHLQIITGDDDAVLAKVRHAGAIFVGPHTPVPLGDYYAGPSHVLPTGGTARFSGPLSANDFLKASSVVRYDAAALGADAADVADFARREGLDAHARAIEIRRRGK